MRKDLLSIKDLTSGEIEDIFSLTDELKEDRVKFSRVLTGKTLVLIFQKPSNRTRVSFEVGMYELGGNSLYLAPDEINLGVREAIKDVAKTLSRYAAGMVLRTFEHKNVLELAKYSTVTVINGLSDFEHPCQALADIYTVREKLKDLKKATFAYIGDGNNVCNSLLYACAKSGLKMNVACPKGYEPKKEVFKEALNFAKTRDASIDLFSDPFKAVKNADVIYTDVWASMGQEEETGVREEIFKGFQLNNRLVKSAKEKALVMHCLPAHRGKEITDEVMDGRNSIVFDQAENRLHIQKAILMMLLGKEKNYG